MRMASGSSACGWPQGRLRACVRMASGSSTDGPWSSTDGPWSSTDGTWSSTDGPWSSTDDPTVVYG